jgi:hypothetical protein
MASAVWVREVVVGDVAGWLFAVALAWALGKL